MAIVQTAIIWAFEKWGLPLINKAIADTAKAFGATEEQAQDIVANEVLQFAEQIGITAAALRSKMPLKIAEALGFTTKGFAKRTIPEVLKRLLPKGAAVTTATRVATEAEATAVIQQVAKSSRFALPSVSSIGSFLFKTIGLSTGLFFMVAQYIDFANWQGPYQKTFQGLLSIIGIHPDTPLPNARTITSDAWKRIYATVEQLNPTTLSFPVAGTTVPYSREQLAKLVDTIAATIVMDGGSATYKSVFAVLLPLIGIGGTPKEPGTYQVEKSDTPEGFEIVYYPEGMTPNKSLLYDKALYQIEKSDTPEGYEMIYYPPGQAPLPSLRYPGSPEPQTTPISWKPASIPTSTAGTLFDYFATLGKSLPPVSERAKLYEAQGLGPASFYTGTAEQNARLLAALKGKPLSTAPSSSSAPKTATPATAAPSSRTYVSNPAQVFTGVISNGVLGTQPVFTPRPNDLINDAAELEETAYTNIGAFLRNLAGRVTYEIKIVSTATNADGMRVTGTSQRIIVGKNKNGTPKYKTVVNKFAEVVLYMLTQTGTRAKIATIVLGPVDALTYKPDANDLVRLSNRIQQNITTTDLPQNVVPAETYEPEYPASPVEAVVAPQAPIIPTSYPLPVDTSRPLSFLTDDGRGSNDPDAIVGGAPLRYADTREPFAPGSTHKTITLEQKAAADAAPTLYDWFASIGQSLPSLASRAAMYRWYNLGPVRSYTGSTEQNNALLSVLKSL